MNGSLLPNILILRIFLLEGVWGHGRMIEPPMRSSIWRFGFNSEPNYTDNELNCGGFVLEVLDSHAVDKKAINDSTASHLVPRKGGRMVPGHTIKDSSKKRLVITQKEVNFYNEVITVGSKRFKNQYEKNNGKCGVCGDPYQGPRDNEAGGKYARGIIVRHYSPGQIIEVTIELTANHQGYFEFRICSHNDVTRPVTQECLNKTLLTIMGHGTRYYIQNDIRQQFVHLLVQLPTDMTCTQCVLQWKYVAGNNKGSGSGYEDCYGCGPQEHFINCADVAINSPSVHQQATIPVESVFEDSLESTSITEYLEKMKNSHRNSMIDFDFLADFLSVDMEDDFWDDMQLFLDSSAEPLKTIVTNTAVNMFPANKDGITKFHHLVKLVLLFQGVAPPSNGKRISQAHVDSESSREFLLDKNDGKSGATSDSGYDAIVSKDKASLTSGSLKTDRDDSPKTIETSGKQGRSINYSHDKFESQDLYDSWADSMSKDSSDVSAYSSSSKSDKNKNKIENKVQKLTLDSSLEVQYVDHERSSDRIGSHSKSESSDSRDISESSDESNDQARIGTRISSDDSKSSKSMEDSWDEASKDNDDQSKSSGDRSNTLKTETNGNGKNSGSDDNYSDSKSNDISSGSREYSKDSESDSTESLNDSKDKNDGHLNSDENSNDLTAGSDDSGSQSKKKDNSIDSEDSWDVSKDPEDDFKNSQEELKESKGRKGESKESEHQGSYTSKNVNGDSIESEKKDHDKGKISREKDRNEKLGPKSRAEDESKESIRGEENKDAKDSRERENNKSKKEEDVDSKTDDRKDSKEKLVSAALRDVEVEAPEIEFKKPEIEVENLELNVEAPDLKDAFGNLKDTIKLEDEKLVAAAMISGSEQNTLDKGKGQADISNQLVHSIIAAGPQILSSKSSTLEEQLRSALVTVFLENHNPSLVLCKDGETKATCGCTENWSKYPLVDMYCTSLCPYGYCPKYLCQCTCPKICRGFDHLVQLTAAINQWCKTNCENGQCPSHMCICD